MIRKGKFVLILIDALVNIGDLRAIEPIQRVTNVFNENERIMLEMH